MLGIYGGFLLVDVLGGSMVFYGIVYVIFSLLEEILQENREKLRGVHILKIVSQILVITTVVCIGFYKIVEFVVGFKWLLSYIVVLLGIISCGITFIYFVVKFFQFIFLEETNFILTTIREKAVFFTGFFSYIVCYVLVAQKESIEISFGSMEVYQADMIKMLTMIFWYFSIPFFSLAFFRLALHKICTLFSRCSGKILELNVDDLDEPKKIELFSNKIWNSFEKLSNKCLLRKALMYVVWLILVAVDTIFILLFGLKNIFGTLRKKLFVLFPRKIGNRLKCMKRLLQENQGKKVMFTARISLVGAFLIVFCIDKYLGIFSAGGSGIYEFMCSMFVIPFLISQVNNLKEKRLQNVKN